MILASFRITGPHEGGCVAEFVRKRILQGRVIRGVAAARAHSPADGLLVRRNITETASAGDRPWWTQCVLRLGRGPAERALGILRKASRSGRVRNRAAQFTKILKDVPGESGIAMRDG